MVLQHHSIRLVEIGVVQFVILVVPGQVRVVILAVDTDVVPFVILSRVGTRVDAGTNGQKGLDTHTLQQILQRLGIALAHRLSLHQSTISIMGVGVLHIADHSGQRVVQVQLFLILAHRARDAGEHLGDPLLKGFFGRRQVRTGQQIRGDDLQHRLGDEGNLIAVPQPEMVGVIPPIHVHNHRQLVLGERVGAVVHRDGVGRCLHTGHDLVVCVQKRGGIRHRGQLVPTVVRDSRCRDRFGHGGGILQGLGGADAARHNARRIHAQHGKQHRQAKNTARNPRYDVRLHTNTLLFGLFSLCT